MFDTAVTISNPSMFCADNLKPSGAITTHNFYPRDTASAVPTCGLLPIWPELCSKRLKPQPTILPVALRLSLSIQLNRSSLFWFLHLSYTAL